ncbi:unnamed protein product [Notodromas monacha]|uniref:Pro-resilin n=1 Tax=Notodromas monacha TaxID=399045 RepID=A0A7R9BZU9_9CRUS|nr:unnamed protein product [Notodromas monacha]CAG0924368.1 unnamed protein product [Notodromas monacha]
MVSKTVVVFALVCVFAAASIEAKRQRVVYVRRSTQAQESGSGEAQGSGKRVYAPGPQRVTYRQREDSNEYSRGGYDNAKYRFGYKVKAVGGGYGKKYGGGSSDEGRGYGGGDRSAEFGHSESRDGAKTTGAYFVELPDGRLQRVDYYVDGYSGFVARVSYNGERRGYGASGEK